MSSYRQRPVVRLPVLAVAFAGTLALSACTQVTLTAADPTQSSSPVAPSPSSSAAAPPSPSPTPSPTPSASSTTAALPTDCTNVVERASYTTTFRDTPLNDPGVVDAANAGPLTPMPSAVDAAPSDVVFNAVSLRCVWRDPSADITAISIEYSIVGGATAASYLGELAASGYQCTAALGGNKCQQLGVEPQYGVDVAHTVFARDGIVISVNQANFPTDNLISKLVGAVWGA